MLNRLSQNVGDTVRKTPNGVLLVCGTVVVITVVASLTVLAWGGKDATEISRLINTILNVAGLILGGGAFVYSGMAAKRSDEAADNTNGKLKEVVHEVVHEAVTTALNGKDDSPDG